MIKNLLYLLAIYAGLFFAMTGYPLTGIFIMTGAMAAYMIVTCRGFKNRK